MALCYFIVKGKNGYESLLVITLGNQPLLDTITLRGGEEELVYKGVYDGSVATSLYQKITEVIQDVVADANKKGKFDAATLETKLLKITQK